MNKKVFLLIVLAGLAIAYVSAAVYVEYFYPKMGYDIESAPIEVLYTATPLALGTLVRNATYTISDYTTTTAINVSAPCQLTIDFYSVNASHFSSFTVEIWNITANPDTLIDSFDMASGPVILNLVSPIELGYNFIFTVAETAPYSATGIVELEVTFEQP